MPLFAISAARRPMIAPLSEADIARSAHEAEAFDAASYGETIDLLPLTTLVRLTERSRAA
jgi:hypothetical protein